MISPIIRSVESAPRESSAAYAAWLESLPIRLPIQLPIHVKPPERVLSAHQILARIEYHELTESIEYPNLLHWVLVLVSCLYTPFLNIISIEILNESFIRTRRHNIRQPMRDLSPASLYTRTTGSVPGAPPQYPARIQDNFNTIHTVHGPMRPKQTKHGLKLSPDAMRCFWASDTVSAIFMKIKMPHSGPILHVYATDWPSCWQIATISGNAGKNRIFRAYVEETENPLTTQPLQTPSPLSGTIKQR